MKKCVVDIRYHAAVGDYSRILVVLTSHQGERKMEETKRSGMSKDQFWNLIEKAKEVCGTDLDASAVDQATAFLYDTGGCSAIP